MQKVPAANCKVANVVLLLDARICTEWGPLETEDLLRLQWRVSAYLASPCTCAQEVDKSLELEPGFL